MSTATATPEAKKPGNPNFGQAPKKQVSTKKWDPKKRYQFQLCNASVTAKPVDWKTGEYNDNPYPPLTMRPNSGVGINPETNEIEQWRYIFGYSSIWVKDQNKPVPGKAQLENPKNFIEMSYGSIFVNGTNTALLDALTIDDEYEGVENPVNVIPPLYRLLDPEKEMKNDADKDEEAFQAESAARAATMEEMLPLAMHYGINIDSPERDATRIRYEFIKKSKQDPAGFNKNFTNPFVKYKYVATLALRDNIVTADKVPGKMVYVETGKTYFDVKEGDYAHQFASQVLQNQHEATLLYNLCKQRLEIE